MEQIEPIATTEEAILPISHKEQRWDPEKAAKRKVRVLKVPHGEDPMTEKTIFEFGGFVYICYAVKTRGRYMIRCLGLAEAEHDRRIMDTDPAAKVLKDAIDDDVMQETIVKEKTPFEAGKLLDNAKDGLDDDSVNENIEDEVVNRVFKRSFGLDVKKDVTGDAIKEAIDDATVQKVIAEVAGDGRNSGPDETPDP